MNLTPEQRAHEIVVETDGFKGIKFYVEIKEVEDMIAAAITAAVTAERERCAEENKTLREIAEAARAYRSVQRSVSGSGGYTLSSGTPDPVYVAAQRLDAALRA